MIDRGKKATSQYAFSLILDSNEAGSLDFVAPDQQTFDYWIDGINTLLGKFQQQQLKSLKFLLSFDFFLSEGNKMNSKEAANDLEFLLAMNTKLRLLDVEGMDLPEEPPPIPREPTNYDFAVEIK